LGQGIKNYNLLHIISRLYLEIQLELLTMSRWSIASSILVASFAVSDAFAPSAFQGSGSMRISHEFGAMHTSTSTKLLVKNYMDSLSGPNDDDEDKPKKALRQTPGKIQEGVILDFPASPAEAGLLEMNEIGLPSIQKESDSSSAVDSVLETFSSDSMSATTELENENEAAEVALVQEDIVSSSLPIEEIPVAGVKAEISSVEEVEEKLPEISPDEEVSLAMNSVAAITLGDTANRAYKTTRKSLDESKSKNMRRVSRSEHERRKSADKILAIRKRMEEQMKEVENELDDKLVEMQGNYEKEANRIEALLSAQVSYEATRQEKIISLISTVDSAIKTKEEDIAKEDKITAEMADVRSKLKAGNISYQLDELIAQKSKISEFEKEQMNDLKKTIIMAGEILQNTMDRTSQIQQVLSNMKPLDIKTSQGGNNDFSDLEELEIIWDEAAKNSVIDGSKMTALKEKFDDLILKKVTISGGEVPESLKSSPKRSTRKQATALQSQQEKFLKAEITAQVQASKAGKDQPSKVSRSIDKTSNKEDLELLGVIANSLGSAAFDSAKAGIFGVRAIIDTAKEENLGEKLKKQDAESVEAMGDLAAKVGKSKSAEQASSALKETSSDLSAAFSAMASLTKKNLNKMKENRKNDA